MTKRILIIGLLSLLAASSVFAESEFFKQFKDDYGEMGSVLSNKPAAERAEITNFVYKKDVATFTFESGRLYLLRHLGDRPTTAIFVGRGHATINIPSHTERQALWYASGDSTVNETFEVAFLNFSDDFDLQARAAATFEEAGLPWKDFNKSNQGEFFFRPVTMHTRDNYFQLLRSHYERAADGFFWIDFNRYVYSFDPNRPEEVLVAYEHEGGDQEVTPGALMQRQEHAVYDDLRMSDIPYSLTVLDREGELRMKGLDGEVIDEARVNFTLRVNADSLKFLSLFLHYNLKLDSMYYEGQRVDYWRRKDFTFLGGILPEYRYRGDTLNLTLWYHGKDYMPALPFVEDPTPSVHRLTFDVPAGYQYAMPAQEQIESGSNKRDRLQSMPVEPLRIFQFQPYVSGYDTISLVSDIGITVNFLKSSHLTKSRYSHFISDDHFRPTIIRAFDYLSGFLGLPLGTFEEWVYPENKNRSMPGLMEVDQVKEQIDGQGGLSMMAGHAAARQWFGALARPRSDREYWLLDALPDYLSLMCVSDGVSPSVSFGELLRRRSQVYRFVETNNDRPLASGHRMSAVHRLSKGAWLVHMIRYLLLDPETMSSRPFLKYLNELKALANTSTFTNEDIIRVTEKHYGDSLDWFFQQWLYNRNIPEFDVTYAIDGNSGTWRITGQVKTKKVSAEFKTPLFVRVETTDGHSTYHRIWIEGREASFDLGPFELEPKEFVFNEFFSVLSKDKVKKN